MRTFVFGIGSRRWRQYALSMALLFAFCSVGASASGLAIVGIDLQDNGDNDGFADTLETVELRLQLRNSTEFDLDSVTGVLSLTEPGLICLVDSQVSVGSLLAGETQWTEAFRFQVSAVDRGEGGLGVHDALTVSFGLSFQASPFDPAAIPETLTLDLDLDLAGGGQPISWFDSFETPDGFGSFVGNNLDFGLHDDEDPEGGLASGYRCQYHEPFCNHASCGGDPGFQDCSPGASVESADAFWWRSDGPQSPDGGRAFTGVNSMHFGVPLEVALGHTTPTGVLEAVESDLPIALGSGPSSLSFHHQVSLVDSRLVNITGTATLDRAVASIQIAGPSGLGIGPWIRLEPFQNSYDQPPTTEFTNCSFDPIDDGSQEEQLFPGFHVWDPMRQGPSSTCAPQSVWANLGSTEGAGSATDLGNAEGPGYAGSVGAGTWVESRIDLSRFRGRSIRVRFLASTTRIGNFPTWQDAFTHNPDPADDGWWIDDVSIVGAIATPATLTVDSKDNSLLPTPDDIDHDGIAAFCDNCPVDSNPTQTDLDLDGWGGVCDCDDGAATTHPGAVEVNDGIDNQCPGDPDFGLIDETAATSGFHSPGSANEWSWPQQPGASEYEVARASIQNAGSLPEFCSVATVTAPAFVDPDTPQTGETFFYINRASLPSSGSWGRGTDGTERVLGACAGG